MYKTSLLGVTFVVKMDFFFLKAGWLIGGTFASWSDKAWGCRSPPSTGYPRRCKPRKPSRGIHLRRFLAPRSCTALDRTLSRKGRRRSIFFAFARRRGPSCQRQKGSTYILHSSQPRYSPKWCPPQWMKLKGKARPMRLPFCRKKTTLASSLKPFVSHKKPVEDDGGSIQIKSCICAHLDGYAHSMRYAGPQFAFHTATA